MALCTKGGEPIAYGFNRMVFGERGNYWEFEKEHLIAENLHMPSSARWRIKSGNCYYLEYRTNADKVKIYYQRKIVSYADYKVGKFYIAEAALHHVPNLGNGMDDSVDICHKCDGDGGFETDDYNTGYWDKCRECDGKGVDYGK